MLNHRYCGHDTERMYLLTFTRIGGAQNIKLKPKDKKTTEDGASDKVKGKGGFRGFRGFM
jgi:hypothetical protein